MTPDTSSGFSPCLPLLSKDSRYSLFFTPSVLLSGLSIILSVPRPVNTIVIMYGKDKDRFAVRQRIGCKCVEGRNVPVNGPTIGHIRDGVFVPL